MSDDQRFERDARAWIELGPVDAPDRVVEAAFVEIERTSQERDLRLPWRLPIVSPRLRLAAVAIVAVVAVGVVSSISRSPLPGVTGASPLPGATDANPTPSLAAAPRASASVALAYTVDRDTICGQGKAARAPLLYPIDRMFGAGASAADRADGLVAFDAFITLSAGVLDQLTALTPPPDLVAGNTTNITQYADVLALLRYESTLLHAGDLTSARAVDLATEQISRNVSWWEIENHLTDCP